ASQLERALEVGGEEGVVGYVENTCLAADLGHGGQISQLQRRIGRCLREDQTGLGPDRLTHRIQVGGVDEVDVDSELAQKLVGEAVGAAIDHVADVDAASGF